MAKSTKKSRNRSGSSKHRSQLAIREELRHTAKEITVERKALTDGLGFGSQQEPMDTMFTDGMMSDKGLVKPGFEPERMIRVCESSSIVPQCVDAMVRNIDGFGYELHYAGDPENENSADALAENLNLKSFFDQVNEKESFQTIRQKMRLDLERCGDGYFEIIRFAEESIAAIYYMDARFVRAQAIQEEEVEVQVPLFRNGELREIPIRRRFRRYVMKLSQRSEKLKYFKEFGDPRVMDAVTGEYAEEGGTVDAEATEVLHFKIGNDTYGVPRWAGQALNVLGMNSADYVNWDLFENQVVPPLAIMVSGGTLTTESVKDIKAILLQKKGMENFNKVLILEAQSEGNITDKTATKVELKELSAARKEDAMFVTYVDKGEHRVRSAFRLPPLYVGRADTYSKSTADSSRMIAEEQVFVPEREAFDEVINVLLMPNLEAKYWKYFSKGPRLITGPEVIEGFKEFAKQGIITINEGIRIANRILGMDIQPYPNAWANYPIPIVLELAKLGFLRDIDDISMLAGELTELMEKVAQDGGDPAEVYRQLSNFRGTLIDIAARRADEEKEVVMIPEKTEEPNEKEEPAEAA